jgi:hypothetical protein
MILFKMAKDTMGADAADLRQYLEICKSLWLRLL